MNRLPASVLVLALAAAGPTAAQSSVYERYDDRYDDGRYEDRYQDARYDYARVISVRPVMGGDQSYQNRSYQSRSYQSRSYQTSSRCYQRSDSYAGSNGSYDGYRDGYYREDSYRDDGYRDDGYRDDRYRGTSTGRTVATVLGGIVGAALGSQVGGGSARYATAAVGSMVGGIAGQKVYENSVRDRYPRGGTVTVCDPVPDDRYYDRYGTSGSGVNAYDVTYEYAGREYTARTNYHPGDRIRVRVDVRPE